MNETKGRLSVQPIATPIVYEDRPLCERPRIRFRLHLRHRAAIRRASAIIGGADEIPNTSEKMIVSRSRSRSPTKSGLTIPGVTICKDCMKLFVVNAMLAGDTVHTGLEKCTVPTGTLFAPSNAVMGGPLRSISYGGSVYPQDRSSSSSSERTSQNQEDALVSARCALALNGIRYCALLR